ncbi:LPXTG cell wall anchor domain-containing protein [Streptomyces sp. KLOTTS4A1]|uniref:LPXTG cell wall anchor domain-containing protein n=1 Tax=Streptomyces sp. KLOTTS4A1 TaxID=3390996 RepID=UPI0039F503A8
MSRSNCPPIQRYDLTLLRAGTDPGESGDAKPGKPGEADDPRNGADGSGDGKGDKEKDQGGDGDGNGGGNNDASPQGGTDRNTGGNLASTGASTSPTALALGGASALTLGAGAVYLARRRRATEN